MFIVEWFFDYPRDKNPAAFALLAHWIVPRYDGPRKWKRAVAGIVRELGPAECKTIE